MANNVHQPIVYSYKELSRLSKLLSTINSNLSTINSNLKVDYLGYEGNSKHALNIFDYGGGQVDDVAGGRSTEIDQHEGLVLIYSCPTLALALPSGLLYEPCCGYFDMTLLRVDSVAGRIMGDVGIGLEQVGVMLCGDDGIKEETTCIACL